MVLQLCAKDLVKEMDLAFYLGMELQLEKGHVLVPSLVVSLAVIPLVLLLQLDQMLVQVLDLVIELA
jgi:hypothetical protein